MPEIRFLGFAFLNAVSSTLWFMIIKDAINHQIKGADLTRWDSLSKTINLVAALLGSVFAIIYTDLSVEICISLQCAANLFMGIMDWKAYTNIKY